MFDKAKEKPASPAATFPCRLARQALWGGREPSRLRRPLLESPWIQRHVAICPRCQKRFAAQGKVNLALQLARSQPHRSDLLTQANRKALKILQRRVRQSPEAAHLPTTYPESRWWDRLRVYRSALTQMAACITLMTLGKIGLLGTMQNAQDRTQNAAHNYVTQRVGSNLADEIFPGGQT